MPLGISPLVDFAFKLMLSSHGHERVTIHFLNAILGDKTRITTIEIQNPIVGPNFDGDKWLVLDILAEDDRGRKFNIEMQTSIPAGLRQRLAFYDARLYVEQMREGDRYHELRPAIVICVLDKTLLKESPRLHTDFRLRDEHGNVLTDDLQVHLLELTKLTVTRENLHGATREEQWAYFLSNAEPLTLERIAFYCIAKLEKTASLGILGGSHKSIFEGVSPRGAGGVWRQARDPKSGHITNRSKKRYAETTLDPGAATVRERSSSSIALANPTAPSRSRLDALGDAAFDAATLKCHAI